MAPRFLRINGLTREDRHRVIPLLRDAVAASGGWITDFKFFSNHSVCINFETTAGKVRALRAALASLGLRLTDESMAALAAYSDTESPDASRAADAEVIGTLQVSFIHDQPDLRIEVPPIPG